MNNKIFQIYTIKLKDYFFMLTYLNFEGDLIKESHNH